MTDKQIDALEDFIKAIIINQYSEHTEDAINLGYRRDDLKEAFQEVK